MGQANSLLSVVNSNSHHNQGSAAHTRIKQISQRIQSPATPKHSSGLTIVELLIVIVVIAILASISLVSYRGILDRVDESVAQSDLRNASKYLEVERTQEGGGTYSDEDTSGGALPKTEKTEFLYSLRSEGEKYCLSAVRNKARFWISEEGVIHEGVCLEHAAVITEIGPVEDRELTVTTLAGSERGFVDGQGAEARFYMPMRLALASNGNLLSTDRTNAIRSISPAGLVTTLAGSSIHGSRDGQGSSAGFAIPEGLAVNSSGLAYVSEFNSGRIRTITPSGLVATLAGSTNGYQDGQGLSAQLNMPQSLDTDQTGNIYVADAGNNRIRKITPSGNVSTFAGSGAAGYRDGQGVAAQFSGPRGIAVAPNGTIYVADTGNHRIRILSSSGYVVGFVGSGVAGSANGRGVSAQFNGPQGIAIDSSGNLYVADTQNHLIRKVTPSGWVTTIAGSLSAGYVDGPSKSAKFFSPADVEVGPSGVIYVADSGNNRIRKIE